MVIVIVVIVIVIVIVVIVIVVIVIVVIIMVIVIIIVAIKVILKRGMSGTSMCDGVKGTFLFMGRGGAITDMEDH